MTTRLQLYNEALRLLGERRLASLNENREPRHLLDDVWNNGGVNACLEDAEWNFALRASRLDYEPSVEPPWGYTRAFLKPSDWLITGAVCSDEYFLVPLVRYEDESGYWYSDLDEIYVRYVSDDANFGTNYGAWPQTFADFVAAYFASKIALILTSDKTRWTFIQEYLKTSRINAKNKDARGDPPRFPAPGSWVKARGGRWGGRRGPRGDGGSPGSLTG